MNKAAVLCLVIAIVGSLLSKFNSFDQSNFEATAFLAQLQFAMAKEYFNDIETSVVF